MGKTIKYRFHHRHLVVDDMEKTVEFYEDVLGARKTQEIVHHRVPIVRNLKQRNAPKTNEAFAGFGFKLSNRTDEITLNSSFKLKVQNTENL